MILDLIRGGDFFQLIITFLSRIFVVMCTMPVHEYAHALIATKLGDNTPKYNGRLTLNPLAHISPMGAIMIFLCGFGYAKPVNVNPRNFKDPKKGMALTAIAGPISNLIMGFIAIFISTIFAVIYNNNPTTLFLAIYYFMYFAGVVNVNLAVFNLLPIPPLDGSRILQLLIPAKYYFIFMQYERYVVLIVFILILSGVLSRPISIISNIIIGLFTNISRVPFILI
ncbi:MAG: site-2 protease family protein [Clostridia bacterium]|nr:site-2 protease family protein [Clostridia bacterium]